MKSNDDLPAQRCETSTSSKRASFRFLLQPKSVDPTKCVIVAVCPACREMVVAEHAAFQVAGVEKSVALS